MKNLITLCATFIQLVVISAQVTVNDSTQIINYLDHQLMYSQVRTSCKMLDSISDAKFYCSKMNFLLGDGSSIPTTYDLIKTDVEYKPVSSSQELICCPEFINSIHQDFRLNDEKMAFKFQEILDVVDRWNNLNSDRSFFRKENTWYFIRDKFFDDYDFFVVETDQNGIIMAISFEKDNSLEIPEDVIKSNHHSAEWGYHSPAVSPTDSVYLRSYLNEQTNFHFEFVQLQSRLVEKISSANFYNAKIVFTKDDFSTATGFNMIKTQDTILHANSTRELLEKATFKASLRNNFILKSKDDALTFEEALDVLAPIGTFDTEDKELIQQDTIWYFVRSESFGDKAAFIAETDEEGNIITFTYNNKAIKNQ